MLRGACLCGGVTFEVERADGPFELCHCPRCRQVSGSGYLAGVGIRVADFRFLSGRELITEFRLPVRDKPPGYGSCFCSVCGSPTPVPDPQGTWFEIPVGILQDDLGRRPDRHIFTDFAASWDQELDSLPRCTRDEIRALRAKSRGVED